MAKRRRSKQPDASEAIFGIIVVIGAVLYLRGINPLDYLNPFAIAGSVALLVLILVAVRVIRTKNSVGQSLGNRGFKHSKPSATKASNKTRYRTAQGADSLVSSGEWSVELIDALEWRVFEKLCVALWNLKGFLAKETGAGADNGVDFYLYEPTTQKKISAVQCKSWSKRKIGVQVVRELQGVVASQNLHLGLLMYSGELSEAAQDFLEQPSVSVKAQNSEQIYADIKRLQHDLQVKLLKDLTSTDFTTPSCPQCDVKLVRRTGNQHGNDFWGCVNFPKCRYTMH